MPFATNAWKNSSNQRINQSASKVHSLRNFTKFFPFLGRLIPSWPRKPSRCLNPQCHTKLTTLVHTFGQITGILIWSSIHRMYMCRKMLVMMTLLRPFLIETKVGPQHHPHPSVNSDFHTWYTPLWRKR